MTTYNEQKKLYQSINGLLHIKDPEIVFLNQSIDRKKEHVALLELEISTMKTMQNDMERVYLKEISPLEAKLNRLKKQLKQNRFGDKTKNKEEEVFYKNKTKAKKKEGLSKKNKDQKPFDEKKARLLFRSLAKKFHPDTVHNEELKIQYQTTMSKINTAYQNHDMDMLESLLQENLPEEERDYSCKEEEISFLQSELKALRKKVKSLEKKLIAIDQSPIMRFRIEINMANKEGRNLIKELKNQLQYEIDELEYIL